MTQDEIAKLTNALMSEDRLRDREVTADGNYVDHIIIKSMEVAKLLKHIEGLQFENEDYRHRLATVRCESDEWQRLYEQESDEVSLKVSAMNGMSEAIRTLRAATLEECAKVADDYLLVENDFAFTGGEIAKSIRALAADEGGKTK